MKKQIKKFAGLLLAAIMLFAVAVPVAAVENALVDDDVYVVCSEEACGGTAGITKGT